MQEMLEAEMTDALGAEKGERTAARLGYRSGYYTRTLVTLLFLMGRGLCAGRLLTAVRHNPMFAGHRWLANHQPPKRTRSARG